MTEPGTSSPPLAVPKLPAPAGPVEPPVETPARPPVGPVGPVGPVELPVRLPAVRWLSPTELLRTGAKAALAMVFGQYADKRELQQGPLFEQPPFGHG
jgi:hypothetical protein